MSGKTILSCGHEDEHGCMGVSVQFDGEECVAGEGFVPTTVYAQYCHECATKLYYEIGKDTGRVEAGLDADRIEALTAEVERLRELLDAWLGLAREHLDTELAGRTFEALERTRK